MSNLLLITEEERKTVKETSLKIKSVMVLPDKIIIQASGCPGCNGVCRGSCGGCDSGCGAGCWGVCKDGLIL